MIGIFLGVVGLFLMLFSPGLGLLLIVIGLLAYLAENNAKKRAKAQQQIALEERRHQELLEAVRQGKQVVDTNTKAPSIWQRNKQ